MLVASAASSLRLVRVCSSPRSSGGILAYHCFRRHLGVARHKGPHANPLQLLQQECMARQLCDADGNRLPNVDWRIVLGISDPTRPTAAPNVRTVGIERVTPAGIDFVLKRGSKVTDVLSQGTQELAFLHTQGQFLPGQSAEQWRGEGHCIVLPLTEVLDEIPHFVITSMVGSNRVAAAASGSAWPVDEQQQQQQPDHSLAADNDDEEIRQQQGAVRESVDSRSRLTEVFQKTRVELENGDVTIEELDASIRAFRLQPDRIECMTASPDSSVLWDRWEWKRNEEETNNSETGDVSQPLAWQAPRNLVPH